MQTGYQNCHLVFCRSVCDIVLDYVLSFGAVKEYNDDHHENDNNENKDDDTNNNVNIY